MPLSHLELPAPAKINLFLHVCGRRPDGYHNLQTVFQFMDVADTLFFTLRDDGKIILETAFDDVEPEQNLIVRAAKLLQDTTGTSLGASIRINKILPMGAGLGGGSSNAATTLMGLNKLWQTELKTEQLQELGVKLGADVPIFIHGHSAWAEGIGEKLTNLNPPEQCYLLVIPPCHVSTAKIFSHEGLTRDSEIKIMAAFLEQGNQANFRNDCEALVRELYPAVDKALKALSTVAKAQMTGTGACVFAAFTSRQDAEKARDKMPADMQCIISHSKNISPLHEALKVL